MGENCCKKQPAQACENGAIENGEKVTQNTTGTTIAENGEKVTQNTTGTTIAENGEKVTQNTTGTTIAENGEKVTQNTTGTTIAEHVIDIPLDPTQELIFPCELQVS